MNWMEQLNDAIGYIENNLSGEIDLDIVAQKSCCSYYNFQRIFSFIFNMPLSEYIRSRKLSLAAAELKNGTVKILDIAVKYGYESQEAFSRAFVKFHGISPSVAKTPDAILKSYPMAIVSMIERAEKKMDSQSFLLEQTEPESIFKRKAGLMGWMRFSITTWSYLEFIGQTNDPWQTYSILSSLCGESFSPVNYTVSVGGIKRLFKTLGFEHEVFTTNSRDAEFLDYHAMKQKIVKHVSKTRRPVLLCNNNALSLSSRGIIIGYEDEGDKLIHWGCFDFLNGGSDAPINIPVENWYKDNTVITLIGERIAFPDPKDIYSTGIKGALDYLYDGKTPRNTDFYEEWKRVLAQTPEEIINEVVSTKQQQTWSLFESRLDKEEMTDAVAKEMLPDIIDPLWCDFALRRACAAMFMEQAKNHLPQAKEHIEQARKSLMNIHELMNQYPKKVDCIPGEGKIDWVKFTHMSIRKEMIAIVANCFAEEENAILHLKNAVELL